MFGGQAKVPLVLRAPDGMTIQGAAQHSQCVEAWFTHIPGVKVVAPSNPYDAKMVLKAAIECDDPVIYFENKILYKEKGEVPEKGEEEPYTLGKAKVVKEVKDVTIVSYSIGMKNAKGAAELLAKDGIDAAVINVHTIKPIDAECVTAWAEKCGKVITVEEHSVIGGLGDAVADVLMGKVNCKFHKIGVNDQFGQSGKAADVLREYGLTADQIAATIKANI